MQDLYHQQYDPYILPKVNLQFPWDTGQVRPLFILHKKEE